ncbi:glycosyltransferase [Adlercreutzia caecimuris]|uniref:glycosyltransferase n=1 Tax=Adlercreutzia caecimuris TaxID=671266 RepID=UPI00258BAB03|nr:glycosyltransferase [Adlercreutzia caecimuris]
MRIACIAYLHGSGGAERQIVTLANGLLERGHEVHLVVLHTNNPRYAIDPDVIVHDLTYAECGAGNRIPARYWALRRCLTNLTPDATVHFWMQSAYFAAMMPERVRGRAVYSERGDPGDDEYSGLLGLVRWAAFKKMSGFVFQTEAARDHFSDSVRCRSAVIPNPVIIPDDLLSRDTLVRETRVVSIGRLAPQKNQFLLLEAFSLVVRRFSSYELWIYGEGELREALIERARQLHILDRFKIIEPCYDVLDQIKNASLFVLSSSYEGMPNALLEAMALGLPCVTTDFAPCGAAASIVKDGLDGLVVSSDPQSLANAMCSLLEDAKLASALGDNARETAEGYSPKRIFSLWDNFLRNVVDM